MSPLRASFQCNTAPQGKYSFFMLFYQQLVLVRRMLSLEEHWNDEHQNILDESSL